MIDSDLTSRGIPLKLEQDVPYVYTFRPFKTAACFLVSDTAAITGSLLFAAVMRDHIRHSPSNIIPASVSVSLVMVLCSLLAAGLYPGVGINPVEELRKSTISITLAFLLLWSATFLLRDLSGSRIVYVLAYVCAIVAVPLMRSLTRSLFSKKPWWGSQVAILGSGEVGRLVLAKLQENPAIGLRPIAVLDDNDDALANLDPSLVTGPLDRCLQITREHRISYGIVCMPSLSRGELLDILEHYGKCFSHLLVVPDLIGITSLGISAREVGGIVGLELTQQLLRPSSQFLKRALDLSLTVLAAPVILPLLLLAMALIKLEDGGPIFHTNPRVGRRGENFNAWKLRSMMVDGQEALDRYLDAYPEEKQMWETCQKVKRDPRVTIIGNVIRKTSIDELPQLWNVLVGEMSIVGPRPMFPHQVPMYGKSFSLYKKVRPGITGLWQVSGRNHLTFKERASLDNYLIRNWSVWMDIYILCRTIRVVLTARGAY